MTFPRKANDPPTEVSYQVMHAIDAEMSELSPGTENSLKRLFLSAQANRPNNNAYPSEAKHRNSIPGSEFLGQVCCSRVMKELEMSILIQH